MKEGAILKLNSSKLGKCRGQHSFTLDYQTPFQKLAFLNMCHLPFIWAYGI